MIKNSLNASFLLPVAAPLLPYLRIIVGKWMNEWWRISEMIFQLSKKRDSTIFFLFFFLFFRFSIFHASRCYYFPYFMLKFAAVAANAIEDICGAFSMWELEKTVSFHMLILPLHSMPVCRSESIAKTIFWVISFRSIIFHFFSRFSSNSCQQQYLCIFQSAINIHNGNEWYQVILAQNLKFWKLVNI